MKKMIALVLFVIMSVTFYCSAMGMTVEKIPYEMEGEFFEPFMPSLNYGGYLATIRGENYSIVRGMKRYCEYDEAAYNFFNYHSRYSWSDLGEENPLKGYNDYIKAGDNYMARYTEMDYFNYYYSYFTYPVKLFDSEFNLIKEYAFTDDNGYVLAISYFKGVYYCYLSAYSLERNGEMFPARIMRSTDFENWEDVSSQFKSIPYIILGDNLFAVQKEIRDDLSRPEVDLLMVSFNGVDFEPIIYENKIATERVIYRGPFVISVGEEKRYISNNGIYYITLENDILDSIGQIDYIYEYDDELIFENNKERLLIPQNQIYDELDRIKNAPYIKLNDTVLGFSELPVVENGRTLVPMSFLFQQMGDSVSWDRVTRSATVQGENDVITFSIDNTTAKVNGVNRTMDVPARLVNGKTMVPLRFLSEELGYTVEWDEDTRVVTISTNEMSATTPIQTSTD